MNALRQVVRGLLVALVSSGMVLGALSLSLVENGIETAALPSTAPTQTAPAVLTPAAGFPTMPANLPSPTQAATLTAAPPTTCPPPSGWRPYTVQSGDTLDSLARAFSVTTTQITQGNCLISANLLPGTVLYLPTGVARPTATITPSPMRTATRTTVPCGPPASWVRYTVQEDDNLYRLSQMFGITVAQLQQANCLGYSSIIRLGSVIWVPYVPTRTPVPPTETQAPTQTPTEAIPPSPTVEPTTEAPTEAVTPTLSDTAVTPASTQAESTPGP